ncbi:hypothetical protein [Streptomyces triculaminicus]|uniref:hypothetical protein n=1 Tax=Streptomyces triculaminicus TaxID=2816232 RepID=UPI0037896328
MLTTGGATRLAYTWIRGRTQVRLTGLHEQGLSDRLRALPPGSRMTHKRPHEEEVVIEVGSTTQV